MEKGNKHYKLEKSILTTPVSYNTLQNRPVLGVVQKKKKKIQIPKNKNKWRSITERSRWVFSYRSN